MIFVTVGTHYMQFNRLVKAAEDLSLLTTEEVVIQRGSSDFCPDRARYFDFAQMGEMERLLMASRVVIAQAGAGSVITVFKFRKPLVLVSRLKKFGEHYNDHQIELACALDRTGRAVYVPDLSGSALLDALPKAEALKRVSAHPTPELINVIHQKLDRWGLVQVSGES